MRKNVPLCTENCLGRDVNPRILYWSCLHLAPELVSPLQAANTISLMKFTLALQEALYPSLSQSVYTVSQVCWGLWTFRRWPDFFETQCGGEIVVLTETSNAYEFTLKLTFVSCWDFGMEIVSTCMYPWTPLCNSVRCVVIIADLCTSVGPTPINYWKNSTRRIELYSRG